MKELNIKEKAQRYDEAIEKLRSLHDDYDTVSTLIDIKEELENIFPELKESEDERIRKEMITYLSTVEDKELIPYESWIAWLEKQGEHANFINKIQIGDKVTRNKDGILVNLSQLNRVAKPTDKIKPKFKVGDTVTVKSMSCHGRVFKGEPFKIVDIIEDNYVSDDGKTYGISLQDGWELVEQNPAWSEEDKKMSIFIGNAITADDASTYLESKGIQVINAHVWLDELKDRVQPQSHWKPSDEQITWLYRAVDDASKDSRMKQILNELLSDLKKLREG